MIYYSNLANAVGLMLCLSSWPTPSTATLSTHHSPCCVQRSKQWILSTQYNTVYTRNTPPRSRRSSLFPTKMEQTQLTVKAGEAICHCTLRLHCPTCNKAVLISHTPLRLHYHYHAAVHLMSLHFTLPLSVQYYSI